MTYSKQQLKDDLLKMGLNPTDSIMIHSSMKSIGDVEGGADTVLDTLSEYFAEGLLMLPTHTWAQMSSEYSLFDPKVEPACVGILPNLFFRRENVVRSLHPTHSIAALGKDAKEYVKGEEEAHTPCPPGGCWDRLRVVNGKILLIGVTHARNTFIHSVEEVLDVPQRLTKEPVAMQVKMPSGEIKQVPMHRHYNEKSPHISDNFDKLMQAFYDTGAAKKVSFGDANCILCDAQQIFRITSYILEKEPNCLIDREYIPKDWWENI